jgi:ATP-dependent RNA helicase DDX3X
MVPTHELVEQVYKESRKLLHKTGISVAKLYGGVPFEPQLKVMDNGCDVLVCTTGRLIDFIESGFVTMSAIRYLIIDEADRILEMGHLPQANKVIFESDMKSKDCRQNLQFSATISPKVKKMAIDYLNDYYYVSSYRDVTNSNIKHVVIYTNEEQKCYKLHTILQCLTGNVLSKYCNNL